MLRTNAVLLAMVGLSFLAPTAAGAQTTQAPADSADMQVRHPISLALEHAEHLSLSAQQHERLAASLERWAERSAEARTVVRTRRADLRERGTTTDREAMPKDREAMRERMLQMDRDELVERMMEMDRQRMRGAVDRTQWMQRRERIMARTPAGPGMERAPIRRGDRPSPELREARAILTRAHREGIRELRDTLTGEQMREFRLLMRVSVAPQAFRR